jgi:hypothetical protein
MLSSMGRALFGRGSKQNGKQESKQEYTKSPESKQSRSSSFTHVTSKERAEILALRDEGHSTHDIAGQMGRSSRTVNKVLMASGLNKNPGRASQAPPDKPGAGPYAVKRRSLLDICESALIERIEPLLEKNPELVLQIAYNTMGITMPKRTLDDVFQEEISNSPEYRRQIVEYRLRQMQHGGRSELDIVREGLAMLFSILAEVKKGDWAAAAKELVASGELSKTVIGSLAVLKGLHNTQTGSNGSETQQAVEQAGCKPLELGQTEQLNEATIPLPGQGGPGTEGEASETEQSGQVAKTEVAPHQQTGPRSEVAPQVSPVYRGRRRRYPVTPELLAVLRKPLPSLSEMKAELLDRQALAATPAGDDSHPGGDKDESA